jgi:hypothetical protein
MRELQGAATAAASCSSSRPRAATKSGSYKPPPPKLQREGAEAPNPHRRSCKPTDGAAIPTTRAAKGGNRGSNHSSSELQEPAIQAASPATGVANDALPGAARHATIGAANSRCRSYKGSSSVLPAVDGGTTNRRQHHIGATRRSRMLQVRQECYKQSGDAASEVGERCRWISVGGCRRMSPARAWDATGLRRRAWDTTGGSLLFLRVAHGERNYRDPHMYCDTC